LQDGRSGIPLRPPGPADISPKTDPSSLPVPVPVISAGRILKVEGHTGTVVVVTISARSAEKNFGAPHFSVVPTQFLMELGAQP